jgi:sterol desaturase/sphingolipid hydroxylase (fatty acid hydroxylase superfamily)
VVEPRPSFLLTFVLSLLLIHSRANVDAVNVNPIEFFLGEYNHLWSLFLSCQFLQVHVVTILVFLALGGFLAGLNHTRFDICISFFGFNLYDSKAHDVHHRIPQSNYGQYMMLWDYLFGSYR